MSGERSRSPRRLIGPIGEAAQVEQLSRVWLVQLSAKATSPFPRRICGIHAGLLHPINGFRADAADFSL
jgi:hypothetical protein